MNKAKPAFSAEKFLHAIGLLNSTSGQFPSDSIIYVSAMLRAAAEQATQLTELSKELEERTVAQDAVEKQLAELRIELQNARDTAGKLFTEHMEYLDSVKAKMMTREELARLICYWMPAPPHATCHDNYCAHKCIAKENPEFEKSMGHLIRGLIEAIISAGVQVRE